MPTPIPPSGTTGPSAQLPTGELGFPSPGALPATSHCEKPNPQVAAEMRHQVEHHTFAHSPLKEVLTHCKGNCRASLALFSVMEQCGKADNKDLAHLGLVAALALGEKAAEFKRKIG